MIGCLKLADFGCCKRFESLTEPEFTDPVGTPSYFSPDLATAFLAHGPARYAGPPADCWALGAIAYEILHGRSPYYQPSQNKQMLIFRISLGSSI